MPMLRLFRLSLLVMLLAANGSPRALAAPLGQSSSDYVTAPCASFADFTGPATATEGVDYECGWLTVPEEYANPNGPTLRLAVVIVKSTDPNPAPDPLVMLQGGPGGSSIDVFTTVLFPVTGRSPLRRNRDLVIFDQRGTLNSEPALMCGEITDLTIDTIEQRLSLEEGERLALAAYRECRERLQAEGVNLAAFDSVENANDIEALRVALGYEQINLYGVSYGTLLALHAMRQNPAGLRAVVLDSVAPPDINFAAEVPRSMQRAFDEFFGACAAEAECNRTYPDLANVFYQLVEKLNAEPARIRIADNDTGDRYTAVLDGDTLVNLLFQFLYSSEALPGLPKMIYELRDTGDSVLLRVFWPFIAFDRTFAGGMYNTTFCAEDADFTAADLPLAAVRPEIARVTDSSADYIAELCADWAVPALPNSIDDPVVSDIPALIINGRFDPITPPAFGEAAARTLSNSFVVTLPTAGHGGALSGDCPADVMYAFLDNPRSQPDTSCVTAKPNVEFYTPRTMVMTPVAWAVLQSLNGAPEEVDWRALGLIALAVVCALFLLTPLLVYPISFLIRAMSKGDRPAQPVRARLGRWAARAVVMLAGVLSVTFIFGAVAVIIASSLRPDFIVLFGLPPEAMPLFALPPILIGLAVVMVICAALSWRDAGWGVPGRLYFAALTMAAIVYLIALAPLGWLWVFA